MISKNRIYHSMRARQGQLLFDIIPDFPQHSQGQFAKLVRTTSIRNKGLILVAEVKAKTTSSKNHVLILKTLDLEEASKPLDARVLGEINWESPTDAQKRSITTFLHNYNSLTLLVNAEA